MRKRKLILPLLILSLLIFAMRVWAHQPKEGKVSATVAPYIYQNHNFSSSSLSAPIMLGGGLIVEGDVSSNGGIETSVNYLQKTYSRRVEGKYNVEKVKRMYVTLGYRHWFNPSVSTALAFYSAYSMGESSVIRTDFPHDERPASSADDIAEYGLDFSVLYEPWTNGTFAVTVDGRYSYSLTDKADEDGNHYGLLIGFKYIVQEKGTKVSKEPKVIKSRERKGSE